MTDFLRNNRYASVIITTALLVVVGLVVSLTRSDNRAPVTLRADQQALQPQATVSLPPTAQPATGGPQFGGTVQTLPPLVLGKIPTLPRPGSSSRPSTSGNNTTATTRGDDDTTPTTQHVGGGATTTTIRRPTGSAFAAGRIAYSAGGSVYTINPDGTDARPVATNAYFPAWAKDHSALAVANADNPGGALYVISPTGDWDGLTTGVVSDAQPTWSPDGSKLAFARYDKTAAPADQSAIWMINRDGSGLKKISTSSCRSLSREPAWSPDGKKIAFWSSSDDCLTGTYTLYVYDVVSGETKALGDADTNRASPAWSPDGKKLAFSSDGDGGVGFEICVMNADGSGVDQLTNVSGDDTDPSWSPDGNQIVFRSDRQGGGLFVMDADGDNVQLLVAGASQPSWT